MFYRQNAHFVCAGCRKVVSIDRQVPLDVIRESFCVLDLQRPTDVPFVMEHPMVCGDVCYGKLLREGLAGYEIAPAEQLCEDDEVEVVMPDHSGAW